MAKTRSEKVVVLGADDESVVAEASTADVALKNAEVEYAAKRDAVLARAEQLREGADNVRLQGSKVTALVSFTDRFTVDVSQPDFPAVASAVECGLLTGIITKTTVARITPSALATVLEVLKRNGINLDQAVTVETGYTVEPERFRELTQAVHASPEQHELAAKVKGVVARKVAGKVTYKANA